MMSGANMNGMWDCTQGMGAMMWGMGLTGLLLLGLLGLGVAALVKYLFFGGRGGD